MAAPNGVADRDGRLRVGDVFRAVNGKPWQAMTRDEAISAIRESGETMALTLSRKRALSPPTTWDPAETIEVELTPGSESLGFNISWDSRFKAAEARIAFIGSVRGAGTQYHLSPC